MNLFSIDEQRLSALIIVLLIFSGTAIYSIINFGEIPENLKDIIKTIAVLIAGVNGINILNRGGSPK